MFKRLIGIFFFCGIVLSAEAQKKPLVRVKVTTQLDADTVASQKPKTGFGKVMQFLKNVREVLDDPSKLRMTIDRTERRRDEE